MAETPTPTPTPKKKSSVSDRLSSQFGGAATKKAEGTLAKQQASQASLQAKHEQNLANEATAKANGTNDTSKGASPLASAQSGRDLKAGQAGIAGTQASLADPSSLLSARQKDVVEGSQFGEAVIGDGLGRLGDNADIQSQLAQQGDLAKGFSSQEELARTERGLESISGDVASRSRALQARQAGSGVKGALAGQGLSNISAAGVQARGNLQRYLQIENRGAQQEGLANLFKATTGVQKFDIAQGAKEKDIALQAGLGFASLGAQERGSKLQAQSARHSASVQANANKGK